MKRPAVLYHYPCPDGAFAALAAHLYPLPPRLPGPTQLRHPNLPPRPRRRRFGPPQNRRREIRRLRERDERVGYEPERREEGDVAVTERFDGVRRVFELIEDGDLWRWRVEESKEFSSGFKDLELEFDVGLNPGLFQQLTSLDVEGLIERGKVSLREKQKRIEEALSESYEVELGGGAFGHCLAVNADAISELRSELGHQLATKIRSLGLRNLEVADIRTPVLSC